MRITAEVPEDLFRQFIKILFTTDPVTLTEIYIDGTKLEANANKYSFKTKTTICCKKKTWKGLHLRLGSG